MNSIMWEEKEDRKWKRKTQIDKLTDILLLLERERERERERDRQTDRQTDIPRLVILCEKNMVILNL